MDARLRTWGPVVVVLALLPVAFAGLRACFPPIGGNQGETSASSTSCTDCHADVTSGWRGSTHGRAEWGFDEPQSWPAGWEASIPPLDAPPVAAIGVEPLFQLLVPHEGGRLQATSLAYDPAKQEWFDVFDDVREPGDWGHWTGGAMTWNSQCATCHATFVAKGYDATTDSYATEQLEHGVSCVSCHGTDHAATFDAAQVTDTCLSCHSLRAELTGTFRPGDAYLDHFAPTWVDLTDAFYADGQIHAESFEGTAFAGSRMHAAGVTCTACHDPHTGGLLRPGDALCEGCHQGMPGFEPHDPHPGGTVGCVGCHMPVTTYMQRDPRHDHGFPSPDPGAPRELGPDACTRCHTDRDRAWATEVAAAWWPGRTVDRSVAMALAAARRGQPVVAADLIAALRSGQPLGRRVSAALALQVAADRAEVREELLTTLQSPEPALRIAAVRALAPHLDLPGVQAALSARLADARRAVRVEAARALRHALTPDDPRAGDYVGYLTYNADQPVAMHEWGTWVFELGDAASAAQVLERAVTKDPRSPVLRDSAAVALSAVGEPRRAARHLRQAVELAADDAGLWMRLGLAEAGIGDLGAAAHALTRATELDPSLARAWYNLGLAELRRDHAAAGLQALRRARRAAPRDPELNYGLAASLWELGEHDEARVAAREVLALQPGHPGAEAILRQPGP